MPNPGWLVLCSGTAGCGNAFEAFGHVPVHACPYCGGKALRVAKTVAEHEEHVKQHALYTAKLTARKG